MSDTDTNTEPEAESTSLDEGVPEEFAGRSPGPVREAPSDENGDPIDPLSEEEAMEMHQKFHPEWYSDTDAKSSDPTAAVGQGFTLADDPNHPEVTHEDN